MTHQVTGNVTELTIRNLTSKAGRAFQKHGVKLDSGQEFELDGFKQKYRVGQAFTNWGVVEKYKVWTETGGTAPGAPAAPGKTPSSTPAAPFSSATSGSSVGFPVAKDSREQAIIRQNSLTNAVNLVNNLTTMGYIPINEGAAKSDGKKAVSEVQDLVIQAAYKFASFSNGTLDAIALEDLTKSVRGRVAKALATDTAEAP